VFQVMTGHSVQIAAFTALPRRLYVPAGLVLGATLLGLSLTPVADGFVARMMLFYLGTVAAYALMPYARRADIPLVSAWVVLLSELAPCISGELISPTRVAADALGVLMAAGPVYVARLRQVLQGDIRPAGRRASEHAL